jgi:glycosyltransferase involved in cell wall biosynthesis
MERPGDVWHCGLRLGMRGLPGLIDHVTPTWMFNNDAEPGIESTSWRVSLRACLVRTEVLRDLGSVRPEFLTLDGASLEMGHRYIRWGALCRHIPWLLAEGPTESPHVLPLEDELRWLACRMNRFWSMWAVWRAAATGRLGVGQTAYALRSIMAMERPQDPAPFLRVSTGLEDPGIKADSGVTVLIPTLDRYPYLLTLLDQLRCQTIPPAEVIVVDQTSVGKRINGLETRFPDLPLKVWHLKQPGQCTSRNLGLMNSSGEYILFLDDDDEIEPDLIEAHLSCLAQHRADASSGVTRETDGTELPEDFKIFRTSDVFPTNNTMVRREVLRTSGLFDLAYDCGARADGDLGMRVHLAGSVMVLNPSIVVLHHHASSGGLRSHKARKVTYFSSQRSLVQRHLPSPTELYLGLRYFSPKQTREAIWIRVLQTFRVRGGPIRRLFKLVIATAQLPSTLWRVRKSLRRAVAMSHEFPRIHNLPPRPTSLLMLAEMPLAERDTVAVPADR